MSTTTTIKVGETAKTITLPEGKVLAIKPTAGSNGTAGVAYLLDQGLGGTNSKGSWPIGASALAPIGPYEGAQKILISCTAGSIDATVVDATPFMPQGFSALYKRAGRKATRQVSSRQKTIANGSVGYTYHNNITVEADVIAIRPTMNNLHTAPLTGVKFSVAATADFSNPIQPTGTWIDGTSGSLASSTVTVAARLGGEQPSLTRPDWVMLNSVAPTDGGKLRYFMVRHFVPAANATSSEGNYDLSTFFHNPSAANAGRVFQTFRQDVDGVGSKAAFTSNTPYGFPGLVMGWDYLLASGEIITVAGSGDSIMEGAVNAGTGNFGNGHLYQAIKLFREKHPDVLIEHANYGLSGQSSSVYNGLIVERLPRVEPDLLVYSPFSCNDGTPTSSIINAQAVLNGTLMTPAKTANTPVVFVGGCPNTALGWSQAQDNLRRYGNVFFRGEYRMGRGYIDMEPDLFDGVSAFKAGVSIDLTHPSEFGAGLVAASQGYPALRRAILGY